MHIYRLFWVSGILAAVTACGGGGGGEAAIGATPQPDAAGIINIGLTDAAVDDVKEVWVQFTGVALRPKSGDEIVIEFDEPKNIELLGLQNGNTAELLGDTQVPAGAYNWIRLGVNAEFDNVMDSYARRTDDSQVELRVPSGSQSGLKLVSGFTITQNQSTNILLDWDLRKALSDSPGQPGMKLRPALRVTDMASFGTLSGSVDSGLLTDAGCTNDLLADTGSAVYVYEGEVSEPADIQGAEGDPLVTASVRAGADGNYSYRVNYLSVGEYSAAFTCQAGDDDPEADDGLEFGPVKTGVTIVNGEVTTLDF